MVNDRIQVARELNKVNHLRKIYLKNTSQIWKGM